MLSPFFWESESVMRTANKWAVLLAACLLATACGDGGGSASGEGGTGGGVAGSGGGAGSGGSGGNGGTGGTAGTGGTGGSTCPDEDGDGVCNDDDVCAGDDTLDADGDGVPDDCDVCAAGDDGLDTDEDGLPDACDNCAEVPNADQTDTAGVSAVSIPWAPEASPEGALDFGEDPDDGAVPVEIGFDFEFFGETYDQIAVSTNGVLAFGRTAIENFYWAEPLPSNRSSTEGEWPLNGIVAAAWADLDTSAGSVNVELRGEAPERRLVIEWSGVAFHDGENNDVPALTAQVILFEGSNAIEIHTDAPTLPQQETGAWPISRGVESPDGLVAAVLEGDSFTNQPLGQTAVRYTTGAAADGTGDACASVHTDADDDGVWDESDICPDGDDHEDSDADGTPDGCDVCPFSESGDSDGDGFCDDVDVCAEGPDDHDLDQDRTPDACDPLLGNDTNDSDGDGVGDFSDACPGEDDKTESCTGLRFQGTGPLSITLPCPGGWWVVGATVRRETDGTIASFRPICTDGTLETTVGTEPAGVVGLTAYTERCDDAAHPEGFVVGQALHFTGTPGAYVHQGIGLICQDAVTGANWTRELSPRVTGYQARDACDSPGERTSGVRLNQGETRVFGFGFDCTAF